MHNLLNLKICSSHVNSRPKASRPKGHTVIKSMLLPKSWDWRNVSGEDFVSPIR